VLSVPETRRGGQGVALILISVSIQLGENQLTALCFPSGAARG